MTVEEFHQYCVAKPGVEATHPMGPGSVWYKVMGKMFSLTMLEAFTHDGAPAGPFKFINLKCDPDRALSLREQHAGVQPGWHQSKKHWNSVMMDGSVPDDLVRELIDHSYEIVVASLPKKTQAELSAL